MYLDESFFRTHITFTSVSDIIQITKPLTSMGLSYFTFDRKYQDHSHLRLTNAGKWIESYYRSNLFNAAIFEKNPKLFTNGFVFWSWLNREPIYSAAAEHNIDNGLTIIERHENYVDFFHFGTSCDNFISPDELITKIEFLYRYIAYFNQKMHSVICEAERTKIKLCTSKSQITLTEVTGSKAKFNLTELIKLTEITRLYLGDEFDNAYLTRKEIVILNKLKKGNKPVDIAVKLGLSVRTLESHVKNIKEKFKCNTLFELGFCLGSISEKNIYPFKIN